MKKSSRRIIVYPIFLLCLLFFVTGCGKQEVDTKTIMSVIDDNVSKGGSLITIFRVEDRKVIASEETYQLKQPDSLTASFEEVMTQLRFPDGLHYSGYRIDENGNVEIEIEQLEGAAFNEEEVLLNKAAIVSTLVQIKQMGKIRFLITDENGTNDISEYDSESFYFYDESKLAESVVGMVCLYLPSGTGDKVYASEVAVNISTDEYLPEKILQLLSARGALPEGAEIRGVSTAGGVAYVNFGIGMKEEHSGFETGAVLYSVVNSLTTLDGIEKVQFLFDGVREEMWDDIIVSDPFSFNSDVIGE